ncbi:uncharacterized protein LOC131328385 [Rhododendron vialii]|uniref:uncharacterized protein LOC131328385 n=1 Tax=Rhododendron vialii TaxID=182163 RepID=UPI00265F08FC|nr:uncharacterized protein LOC131328385 [Rhododendron vialii]
MDLVLQQINDRGAKAVASLVQKTDLPFIIAVMAYSLPSKFKLRTFEPFDSTGDPLDHLETYKAFMLLHGILDQIMCRAFPTTLKGSARVWFGKLASGSIKTFSRLSQLFVEHFYNGRRQHRPTTYLLSVKQKEDETMRAYLKRFNNEALLVDEADDKVVLLTFIGGLQSTKFVYSLSEKPPGTVAELMHKAQKHINAEEAMAARGKETLRSSKKRAEADPPKPPRDSKSDKKLRSGDRLRFRERFERFTPLNTMPERMLVHLINGPELQWPRVMKLGVLKDQSKYCHFHRDHVHETSDCIKLKK